VQWKERVKVRSSEKGAIKEEQKHDHDNLHPAKGPRRCPLRSGADVGDDGDDDDEDESASAADDDASASAAEEEEAGEEQGGDEWETLEQSQDMLCNRILPWLADCTRTTALRAPGMWPSWEQQLARWSILVYPQYAARGAAPSCVLARPSCAIAGKVMRPRLACPDLPGGTSWPLVAPGECFWRDDRDEDICYFVVDMGAPGFRRRSRRDEGKRGRRVNFAPKSRGEARRLLQDMESVADAVTDTDDTQLFPTQRVLLARFRISKMRVATTQSGMPDAYVVKDSDWFNDKMPMHVVQHVHDDRGRLVRRREWRPYWTDPGMG